MKVKKANKCMRHVIGVETRLRELGFNQCTRVGKSVRIISAVRSISSNGAIPWPVFLSWNTRSTCHRVLRNAINCYPHMGPPFREIPPFNYKPKYTKIRTNIKNRRKTQEFQGGGDEGY